jgi:NAD(P)-dependent dehydrogenase (short-subunit alcohol dehydrogenase family)
MENLSGKICLVTGATRGIGLAIAKTLLECGAKVAICGRRQDAVDETVRALSAGHPDKVTGKAADVRNHDDVEKLFQFVDQRFGGLDVLVNNAGVGVFSAFPGLSIQDWRDTIETNLYGVFYCSKEAVVRFGTRGGGYIVNISSLAGKNPFAGGSAYNASKFALNGFSEAMMLDLRHENVRVSYIMPGSVATEFSGAISGQDWKIWPEDIAEIVRMLLQMPARTLISRVEVRPSQPKR